MQSGINQLKRELNQFLEKKEARTTALILTAGKISTSTSSGYC